MAFINCIIIDFTYCALGATCGSIVDQKYALNEVVSNISKPSDIPFFGSWFLYKRGILTCLFKWKLNWGPVSRFKCNFNPISINPNPFVMMVGTQAGQPDQHIDNK